MEEENKDRDYLVSQIDLYNFKFEQELKLKGQLEDLFYSLNDQIRDTQSQLRDEKQLQIMRNKIKVLEKELNRTRLQHNKEFFGNRLLRNEVQDLRIDKMYTRGNLDGFSSQLSKCNSEIINRRQIKGELTQQISRNSSRMELLRSRTAQSNRSYREKMSVLKADRSALAFLRQDNSFVVDLKNKKYQNFDCMKVTKHLLQQWQGKVKYKKHQVIDYKNYIWKIKDIFKSITKVTGIKNKEEIIQICIKTWQQQQTLQTYLQKLDAKIDKQQDFQRKLQKCIQDNQINKTSKSKQLIADKYRQVTLIKKRQDKCASIAVINAKLQKQLFIMFKPMKNIINQSHLVLLNEKPVRKLKLNSIFKHIKSCERIIDRLLHINGSNHQKILQRKKGKLQFQWLIDPNQIGQSIENYKKPLKLDQLREKAIQMQSKFKQTIMKNISQKISNL